MCGSRDEKEKDTIKVSLVSVRIIPFSSWLFFFSSRLVTRFVLSSRPIMKRTDSPSSRPTKGGWQDEVEALFASW